MSGSLVLSFTYEGGQHEHGAYSPDEAADLLDALAADGIADVSVYDGVQYARERFPLGARVLCPRKYWRSPLGSVTAGEGGATWGAAGPGPEVMVRFDGDAGPSWWPARWLTRVDVKEN